MNCTDKELFLLLQEDDRTAFNFIYRRYWKTLYDIAYRSLQDPAQAADIIQDLFTALWLHRRDWQIENPGAYLYTAVRSRILNYVQRDLVKDAFYEPFEAIATSSFTADGLIREKEMMHLVVQYIDTLPVKRREIFLLHFADRLSTQEIASRLGLAQKTVQNQLHTAVQGLFAKAGLTAFLLLLAGF
ncbi:RNA polymerase sigma factor [Chitinophaga cymbidii]|uniref:RNA polymerase sigma factor n=1 Tax=Chitinophaga cymbidii TaxID=1096750 RepID=A0A512RJI2_9BACT|nr:sigma-70 family RNA polymerase sigma factor [Chitinophaga cymbidii]GEP95869.1 RNA polymerase sigma factor [Chitinophaga cymbidii]